ncbi:MAG: nucleoside 2-deoxyribosyltransferase domain-containing protein [Nanoarchaeota archaeon]
MAIIIEAPNDVYSLENKENVKLFLAGGITNCPDWQKEIIKHFEKEKGLTIYNPRREYFDVGDPNASEAQITWEYLKLLESDIILYWFSKGSLNPIVLYELGRWGNSSRKTIFIGIDEGYERKQDVEIQTKLARPDVKITYSLSDLASDVLKELNNVRFMKTISNT